MYDTVARYYDLIHAELTADVDFVMPLLTSAARSLESNQVLELGCGSGRVLFPLARAGLKVTGVDNAPAMLAIAQQRLGQENSDVQQRVSLIEADFLEQDFGQRFAAITLLNNTLMHVPPKRLTTVLQRLRRQTISKGQLVIDLVNPASLAMASAVTEPQPERTFVDPETADTIEQSATYWTDLKKQEFHLTWYFTSQGSTIAPQRPTRSAATFHYYYPHQLQLAMEEAGWAISLLAGDYDRHSYEEDSERLLIVAQNND